MVKELHIDIETFSATDISRGVYRYAEDPFFKIQIFGYAFDDKPRKVLDLENGDKIPRRVIKHILNKDTLKWAHNAAFERVCLSVHILGEFGLFLDPTGWRDTAVYGATLGLPRSLDQMGAALGIDEDAKKDKEGKRLIQYFSKPCKPTKVNGGRTVNKPSDAPEDWNLYLDYNGQDVTAEHAILKRLRVLYPEFPEHEWRYYEIDQRINDTGIPIDLDFVSKAITLKDKIKRQASRKLKRLTGVEKVTQIAQLKAWAADQGFPIKSLDAESKEDYLNDRELAEDFPNVYKMIELVEAAGGSAVAKYDKILDMVNKDGRLRGQIMFYGAGATGRFAGRGVQVQNLPRVYLGSEDLDKLRKKVKAGKRVSIGELTQLCRTSIMAEEENELTVSDYSQIEARITPWYAGEEWALQAFRDKKDIYVATAMQMYNLDEAGGLEQRQDGKTATLALGYGGGRGALIAMGALRDGIPENKLQTLVDKWRRANPNIVTLWRNCEKAAKAVIKLGGKKSATLADGKLKFTYKREGRLFQIWLPSGRALSYYDAHVDRNGKIKYLGGLRADGTIWHKDTFGGKLVENIVQATARDILCHALDQVHEEGYRTIFHVHDEIIAEVEEGFDTDVLSEVMTNPAPTWANGLPLGSDGDTIKYYRKV